MDPRNPYGQNSGYMGLLNNVDIGASEITPFSSQQSEAPSQSQDTPVERKAIEDYKTIMEGKMEELARKEKLSKLAILDTLLAKKDPPSLSEETVKNKLLVDLF
ncbi:hypothetical protein Bca4012_078493 [Brassica carinata]